MMNRQAALDLWRRVTVEQVSGDVPDLTQRQTAILMTIYLTDGPHTVRGLAAALNLGKPAVTRALDTLEGLGLLRRTRDEDDRRSVLVHRTVKGAVHLSDFGDLIARRAAA
jgi:DNA-binding MarR family transcriptional regulator